MKTVCILVLIVFKLQLMKTQSGSQKRCQGREVDIGKCCTEENPCVEGEGDCENNDECEGNLLCGKNNCKQFGDFFHDRDDCCVKPKKRCQGRHVDIGKCCTEENPCEEGEGDCDSDTDCEAGLKCGNNNCEVFGELFDKKDDCCVKTFPQKKSPQETFEIPLEPPEGQRCRGRNYDLNEENNNGKRCCTPEEPCDEGEGDCDGPDDGGKHDEHRGCKGNLQCGTNNCKQFGHYYHEKDDCCERAGTSVRATTRKPNPNKPFVKPPGHNCGGRNDGGRTCCTPENPCVEGEGDCDGPADGGAHDGDLGCQGDLVCGSNNCLKWGLYFHEKDDCCERPIKEIKEDIASFWNLKLWKPIK